MIKHLGRWCALHWLYVGRNQGIPGVQKWSLGWQRWCLSTILQRNCLSDAYTKSPSDRERERTCHVDRRTAWVRAQGPWHFILFVKPWLKICPSSNWHVWLRALWSPYHCSYFPSPTLYPYCHVPGDSFLMEYHSWCGRGLLFYETQESSFSHSPMWYA
jgi:hypothetical protein